MSINKRINNDWQIDMIEWNSLLKDIPSIKIHPYAKELCMNATYNMFKEFPEK